MVGLKLASGILSALVCVSSSATVDLTSKLPSSLEYFQTNQCLGDVLITRGKDAQTTLIVDTNTDLEISTTVDDNTKFVLGTTGKVSGEGFYFRVTLTLGANVTGLSGVANAGPSSVYVGEDVVSAEKLSLTVTGSGDMQVAKLKKVVNEIVVTCTSSGELVLADTGNNKLTSFTASLTGSGDVSVEKMGDSAEFAASVSSSGTMCVGGIGALDNAKATMTGSGDLVFFGSSTSGTAELLNSGSGDLFACAAPFSSASVVVSGSGDISVASSSLSGSLTGSGDVIYLNTGNSNPTLQTLGSGRLETVNACPATDKCMKPVSPPSEPVKTSAGTTINCSSPSASSWLRPSMLSSYLVVVLSMILLLNQI